MKVISFLPDDYVERRARRRANIACVVIAGGSLLVMGLGVALVFIAVVAVAGTRYVVEQQYQEASRQIDQLKKLEDRKAGLMHKVELSTALLERVPRSCVLARLTNHLPANTSLLVLTMKVEEVEAKEPPADAKKDKAAGASAGQTPPAGGAKTPAAPPAKVGRKGKAETAKVKQCTFRLDGLAPTDVQVAEYITHLLSDPIFQDVDLVFSEEFPYKEGIVMRRFQLSFRLSLTAEKALESAEAGPLTMTSPAGAVAGGKP
jgi:Tfp pilus assembly protein PilN